MLLKSNRVEPIYSYRFPILKNSSRYLINIEAMFQSSSSEENVIPLKISKQTGSVDDIYDFYELTFASDPMNREEERIIIILEDYFERLSLLPKKISLKDDQLVLFQDTINSLSFYQTIMGTTIIILPHERTDVMYLFY